MRLALLVIVGCGDNIVEPPGCPAGTVPSVDGTCEAPGVPPTLCAIGWQWDGKGCDPILPAQRCPVGTYALPGELECHAVDACGTEKWGDIPLDGSTIFVDASYTGTDYNGTIDKPYPRIQLAISRAPVNALIAIAPGTYREALYVYYQPVRMWGTCAERVLIEPPDDFEGSASLMIYDAQNVEVHHVSFGSQFGFNVGVIVDHATNATFDHVWFRDTLAQGLDVRNREGSYDASVHVRHALFERGITAQGANLELDEVAVRNAGGIAVSSGDFYPQRALLDVQRAVIEDNLDIGIAVNRGDAIVDGVVVRGTLPQIEGYGAGIAIANGTAAITKSLLAENHDAGVRIGIGAQATIEAVVVRGTRQRALERKAGHGIAISGCSLADVSCNPALRTSAIVRQSLITDNQEAGISVTGADATIDRVLVTDTLLGSDGYVGDGILVLDDGVVANATVTRTVSGGNVRAGLASFGGVITLGANVLACNTYDLGAAYSEVFDLGANRCGCATLAACNPTRDDLAVPTRSW